MCVSVCLLFNMNKCYKIYTCMYVYLCLNVYVYVYVSVSLSVCLSLSFFLCFFCVCVLYYTRAKTIFCEKGENSNFHGNSNIKWKGGLFSFVLFSWFLHTERKKTFKTRLDCLVVSNCVLSEFEFVSMS